MKKRHVLSDWVINWCWYLHCELDDEAMTATIHDHFRRHGTRDEHPKANGKYRLEEQKEGRLVVGVIVIDEVGSKRYEVLNPKNVFSYGDGNNVM